MLLYAVSVLVVAQSSSEIPEGLMNNPVLRQHDITLQMHEDLFRSEFDKGPYRRFCVLIQHNT